MHEMTHMIEENLASGRQIAIDIHPHAAVTAPCSGMTRVLPQRALLAYSDHAMDYSDRG
jgi:hypothetical protein